VNEFLIRVIARAGGNGGGTAAALLIGAQPSCQPGPPSTRDSCSAPETRGMLEPWQSNAVRQFALGRFPGYVQVRYDDN
jgi:hypothetical protein